MSLTFDAERHEYFWNGKKVPGVTSILAEVMNWSAVPEDLLEAGRARGTAVHRITQAMDEGTHEMVPRALEPYVAAYSLFKLECRPQWSAIEKMVYHKVHDYAGTPDRVGQLWPSTNREQTCIVDIKSGQPHAAHALQLSAYREAVVPNSKAAISRYVLYLKENGLYKLEECKTSHQADFGVYLALLIAGRWKELHRC